MAISPQQLTIYLTSAHRAVIFAIAQLSCLNKAQTHGERYSEDIGHMGSRVEPPTRAQAGILYTIHGPWDTARGGGQLVSERSEALARFCV